MRGVTKMARTTLARSLIAALVVTLAGASCSDDSQIVDADGSVEQGGPAVDDDGDGFSEADGDCDDADPAINPDADEVCDNEIDDNCNGAVDGNEPDGDGDGFGPCQGDCDDDNPAINPAAPEIQDYRDNNCDGIVDDDFDGDGYTVDEGDCNDGNPEVHPGVVEKCGDGVDNNCNNATDADEPDGDGDGYGPCAGDCDDSDPDVNPAAAEVDGDGIDNNCDQMIDVDIDGDGWTVENGDCDDEDPDRYPGAPAECGSSEDLNCNGTPDDQEPPDKDGDGFTVCDGDCDDYDAGKAPDYVELAEDGVDNNCNGEIDEDVYCDCPAAVPDEAQAIDICQTAPVVIAAGGEPSSHGILTGTHHAIEPRKGCSFITVSTGAAWSTSVQDGTAFATTGNPVSETGCMVCTTPPTGNPWEHPTPDGCCENSSENDPSWVRITVRVPKNATGFKFDFIYLSAEYPEWVHSDFNDTFYAVVDSTAMNDVQNVSFDIKGQPLTVNNGWFEHPSAPTQSLAGTGYDTAGSSSGWLTTTAPCTPGEDLVITFWVHDEGDHILDSAVIIDNWRWIAGDVGGPFTIK